MKMIKLFSSLLLGLLVLSAGKAVAGNGNGAPTGAHYNLNIIGVENPKNSTLTDSNRHTIFVALGKKDNAVQTNIYLVPGLEWKVCDGNGFDAAYNCDGQGLGGGKVGAVFQLPCNQNLHDGDLIDHDGDPETPEIPAELVPCDPQDAVPDLAYEVWGRALGKPYGGAKMTTCATETDFDAGNNGTVGDEVCSLESVLFFRTKGKQTFQNVTNELTSLVACFDPDPLDDVDEIECFRYALFSDEFIDWFWKYENQGLRLAQLRFYEIVLPD